MKLSVTNEFWECPTERQKPTGTGTVNSRQSTSRFGTA